MSDLDRGLAPQFVREEEGNIDVLNQILVELKKINTQLILITRKPEGCRIYRINRVFKLIIVRCW